MHIPEQQSAGTAQRSCCGRHPVAQAQRLTPSSLIAQRPEQQSLSVAHSSCAGWHPGRAWQRVSGPAHAAATVGARPAGLAGHAAAEQQHASGRAAPVGFTAGRAAAVGRPGARLPGRGTGRVGLGAQPGGAGALAAVGGRRAHAAHGLASRRAADARGAAQVAAITGARAGLAVGGAPGRREANRHRPPRWRNAALVRAAVGRLGAGAALGAAGRRGALAVRAVRRAAFGAAAAGGTVGRAGHDHQSLLAGQLDVVPAGGSQSRRQENQSEAAFQGSWPARARRLAVPVARPRGNSDR